MDDSLRTPAEQLASEIAGQAKTAENLNGLIRLMMKSALERMLNSELDVHLGRKALVPGGQPLAAPSRDFQPSPAASPTKRSKPNRRNGHSQKTVQGDQGELTIATPRDRDGDNPGRFPGAEDMKDADLLLSKIEVPTDLLASFRYQLFRLGISPASLFPGLPGLVDRIRYDNIRCDDELS
jgi:putative transposase